MFWACASYFAYTRTYVSMCVHMHQYLRQLFSCGTPYGCGLPMGMCLICLAWAALWLRPPYGRVLNMFGMGRLSTLCAAPNQR